MANLRREKTLAEAIYWLLPRLKRERQGSEGCCLQYGIRNKVHASVIYFTLPQVLGLRRYGKAPL